MKDLFKNKKYSKKWVRRDSYINSRTQYIKSSFLVSHNIWGVYYGVIYMLIDVANSLVYIGQTIRTLRDRFKDHLRYPSNKFLKKAFDRYNYTLKIQKITASAEQICTVKGEFIMKIIRKCENLKELNQAEKEEIRSYKSCVKDYHSIINGKIIPLHGYNVDRGGRGRYPSYGPTHPLYLQIEEKPLIELIKKGYFRNEIAHEFNVSGDTISKRVYDLWHKKGIKNLQDAREFFGSKELYKFRKNMRIKNAHHMKRILKKYHIFLGRKTVKKYLEDDLTAEEIDEIVLPELVYRGYSSLKIGEMIGLPDSHAIATRFQEILEMKYIEAKDFYYFRKRIIPLIREGYYMKKIIYHFNRDFKNQNAPIIKSGKKAIYSAFRRIWKSEYRQFKKISLEIARWNTDPKARNRAQFTHFFNYLRRLYVFYPNINMELLKLLEDSNLTVKEIDASFLKYMIGKNSSLEEIASKLDYSYKKTRRWIKYILKISYRVARDKYYWKSKILKLIKQLKINHLIKNIASKLKESPHTIRGAITRLWDKEYEKLGGLHPLFRYLKKIHQDHELIEILIREGYNEEDLMIELGVSENELINELKKMGYRNIDEAKIRLK